MQLSVLSETEIEKIHKKTLEVFQKVGVKIAHEGILRKLQKAGAIVDHSSQNVKFAPEMVEELLDQAPSVAVGYGINGKKLEWGGANRYYGSLTLDPFIYDYHDGLRRPILEDVRKHTIIGESLDRISHMSRMEVAVSDVPAPDCYLKTLEVFLSHLTKNISIMPASPESCRLWLDVSEVIADAVGLDLRKTPIMTVGMAVTTPLQIHSSNIEIMNLALEYNCPVYPTVCPMAGTTSPYSIAGTVVLANTETLATVLLTQIQKPGHPVFYAFAPSVTDMKSGHDLYDGPNSMIWKAMFCQMGKFYKLPISHGAGGSLTHLPDIQNGAESFAYMLISHLCGQNRISGMGSLGNAKGMSAEQIIMHCGLVDMAEFLMRGVEVSDRKLALESIESVGPGGNYLTDQLTLDLLRSDEFFSSPYLDMTGGYRKNAPNIHEIAHQKAEALLAAYKPAVPEKVRTAIKSFFKDKYRDPKVADL